MCQIGANTTTNRARSGTFTLPRALHERWVRAAYLKLTIVGAQKGPRLDVDLYNGPNADLVQQVTGIEPDPANGHAFLEDAGFKSLQRLILADANGGAVVGLFPGELKPNAQFLYSEHRAETFLSTALETGWRVWANPHIAFRQAPVHQRLYLEPTIDVDP